MTEIIYPHDLEMERSVLGGVLLDATILDAVKEWIPTETVFYSRRYREIWKAILKCERNGTDIDSLTVYQAMPKNKRRSMDIKAYEITGLPETVPSLSSTPTRAKKIYELWLRRKLIIETQEVRIASSDSSNDITNILSKAHDTIGDLIFLQPGSHFSLTEIMQETIESISTHTNIIPTEVRSIDEIIDGLGKKEISIIAGRPGSCKSTTAVNIARNLVLSGKKVMMINREMPNVEIMKKFITIEAGTLSYKAIRLNAINDQKHFDEAIEYISENYKSLIMYDNLKDMQSTIREIKKQQPDVVIDDHLGYIEFPATDKRDLRHKIGDVSKTYKWLAKEQNFAAVLVSQLNRNLEHRTDRVPRLSDLAESGNLEQDAAVVLFTHYEWTHKYEEATHGAYGLDLVVAKNRYGSPGRTTVGYCGDRCVLLPTPEAARNYLHMDKEE